MPELLSTEKSEISLAHTISTAQYPTKVTMVSERSLFPEDQIMFSYPFYRLVFCTFGVAEFVIIDKNQRVNIELEKGEAIIIKPGAFIKSINRKPYETCGILLRNQSMDFFINDHLYRHKHRFMLHVRNVRNEVYILFGQCVEFSKNNYLLEQYARLIWTHIDEMIKQQMKSKGSHVTFLKAKTYVNKHFQHSINRKFCAAELGMNEDYLNALFHRFVGMSFSQYLLKIKLEKANDLLHDKDLSIAQVAFLSGFSSSTYFGRQFKKHHKMTPLSYRKTLHRV